MIRAAVLAAIMGSAQPSRAYDFKLTENIWGAVDTHLWGSYVWNGDEPGFFARGLSVGTLNYRFDNGITVGGAVTAQYFTNYDEDIDNLGDGPHGDLYTAIGYVSGPWGDVLYGKTFGAVTELIDIAPSAIGVDYSVNTPFFIHVERPRFAPRSPTASPDFRQPHERFGYYSGEFDGFRLGVTYAESIQDEGAETLTNIHSKNAFDVALVWTGQIGDVRLRTTGGYQQAEANVVPANVSTAGDQYHWAAGATLWWGNWILGGNYAYTDNTLGLRNVDNESWQFGVMYTWRKFAFSASRGESTDLYSRDLVANPVLGGLGDPTMKLSELAVSYSLHENAKLSVAAIKAEYDDRLTFPPFITDTVSNSGTYGVVQLYVHF
jgi:predicted porin